MDARPMSWMVRSFLGKIVRVFTGVRMLGAMARSSGGEQTELETKQAHANSREFATRRKAACQGKTPDVRGRETATRLSELPKRYGTLGHAAIVKFSLALLLLTSVAQAANEPQWIWSPAQQGEIPADATCYFRKSFDLNLPESGEIQITADDTYELFVNGRAVAKGEKWQQLDTHDITKFLLSGRNTVAVKCTNVTSADAALVARVVVKGQGGTFVGYPSDATWKTAQKELPQWTKVNVDDRQWLAARAIGPFGSTKPWFDEVVLAGGGMASRFKTQKDFSVEQILSNEQTGSVICLAFNEFGELLASREDGGLLLLRDTNKDGGPDTATVFCDQIRACQGILPLNGQVLVIAAGPKGPGLYRLSDEDSNGKCDKIELLLKFKGEMGEHGPHALSLGPDGLVYIMLGNKTEPEREVAKTSPYRNYYEADLLTPKYEDPRGHAVGIKAPGGRILRTDPDASFLECYSGGMRNAYDMVWTRNGDLFTYDSDMEWDVGTPWYRPTRVFQMLAGSDCGWRSGWSVWPEYFYDSIPGVADTGRGSPTGIATYNHVMYPRRYHDALFMGDWGRGRIVALKLKPNNGGYTIEGETFVEGKPLNITDCAVGPDGWLYFCTGGRATDGGIYRVVWNGKVPPAMTDLGKGLEVALKQPQFDSAYARQQCAIVRQSMGAKWDAELPVAVLSTDTKLEHRLRGLDLMQLMGPFPTPELLTKLSVDPQEQIRMKAAALMGLHYDASLEPKLLRLLRDLDPNVQRVACESLVRADVKPPLKDLLPLLNSTSPQVAWAATRLLETLPVADWQDAILKHENSRVFLQGGLALIRVAPEKATCLAILNRNLRLLGGFLNDADFLGVLRLSELALAQGKIAPEEVAGLRAKIADEYPTKDSRMNRELVRLMAYLQEPRATELFLEQLRGTSSHEEKLHVALHARFLTAWTTPQKLELLTYLEFARTLEGGHSYQGYIENVSRDFFVGLTESERRMVLAEGTKWPSSALSVLAKLPPQLNDELLEQIIALDRRLPATEGEAAKKLGIGIVAIMGRCPDAKAQAYLREVFERDPNRRGYIAMSLAQQPAGENWPLLVQSVASVEGMFAQEVLVKLASVDRKPEKPEAIRQVILRGIRLGESGGRPAIALLERWTGQSVGVSSDPVMANLAKWQNWFAMTYPNEPAAKLPVDDATAKWTLDELATFLGSPEASRGDAARGEKLFAKAKCADCHRYGDRGEGIGPDLSTVSKRFQKKEILESILHPSQTISDQYASQIVQLQDGRTINGLVSPQPEGGVIVLMNDGQKVPLAKEQIDSMHPSKTSAMPAGLLNALTLEEIADLFQYLGTPPARNLSSRRAVSQ